MELKDVINKDDLSFPYDVLADFLTMDEIFKLEAALNGRQIKFRKYEPDAEKAYPEIVPLIGLTKTRTLVKRLSGSTAYFPKIRDNCSGKIKGLITAEFDGYNYTELSRKYGYTERSIRNIVHGRAKPQRVMENQISLDDLSI